MKAVVSTLALIAALAVAQQRCDAEYPEVYCNTTEILAYQSTDCTPFHIFLARGSDEPYPGRQGNVSSQVCASLGKDKCGFESILYPAKSAAWGKDEWCKSAGKGASDGQAQVKAYSDKCPDSKLIILGFSQGASVAQDILGGGGGHTFECDQPINPALNASIGDRFVAAVTFGTVARSRNQNYTVGDGKPFDGTRARTPAQLAALNAYSDRLREYCHFGDPICAVGSQPVDVKQHLDYFLLHNDEVIAWVTEKAKASTNEVGNDNTVVASNSSTQATTGTTEALVPVQTKNAVVTGAADTLTAFAYAPLAAAALVGAIACLA
ncbi:hypothetical protein ACEQ8H_007518 [Pleosporales sp. CAS-2024a]